MSETLVLFAATAPTGEPVREEVLVEPLGEDRFRFLRSPGLVIGFAAGDVFKVTQGNVPRLVERGGKVAIHLFGRSRFDQLRARALQMAPSVEATIDGGYPDRLIVLTAPLIRGNFTPIEQMLSSIISEFPDAEWYYSNVYDENGVTPLNWWVD